MKKKVPERRNKRYSKDEEDIIHNLWGEVTLKTISRKTKRSEAAILSYGEHHDLGGMYKTGQFLSTHDVGKMFNIDGTHIRRYWIGKYNLKAERKVLIKRAIYRISLDDLLFWCEANQDKWSSIHLEQYALGSEPVWLKRKRQLDFKSIPKRRPWSENEVNYMLRLFEDGYSSSKISKILKRSPDSILMKKKRILSVQNSRNQDELNSCI